MPVNFCSNCSCPVDSSVAHNCEQALAQQWLLEDGFNAAAASASMSLLASPLQLTVPVPNSVTPIAAPPSTQPQEPSPITVALAQIDHIRPLVLKEINQRYADADSKETANSKERSKKFRKVMRTAEDADSHSPQQSEHRGHPILLRRHTHT